MTSHMTCIFWVDLHLNTKPTGSSPLKYLHFKSIQYWERYAQISRLSIVNSLATNFQLNT